MSISGYNPNRIPTETDFNQMTQAIHKYGQVKERKEYLQQRLLETQAAQVENKKAKAELAAKIEMGKANLEKLNKIEATALKNIAIGQAGLLANQEIKAQVREKFAAGIIQSRNSIVQIEARLITMPGSDELLTTARALIAETILLEKANANGEDISQGLKNLPVSIRELVFGVQALVKTNKADKK